MSTEMIGVGAFPRGANASVGNGRKDITTNYELDRSIRHTQQGAGGIKRLSVGVVVNYRGVQSAPGKPTTQALSATELEQIQNLVKEAMGYSRERGDTLNVVNSLFAADSVATPELLPIWRQPDNISMAMTAGKYLLLGLLALYLWFAVLRPLLRKHLVPEPAQPLAVAVVTTEPEGLTSEEQTQERQNQRHLDNAQYAKDAALKDPRMVAMLIRQWMESKGG